MNKSKAIVLVFVSWLMMTCSNRHEQSISITQNDVEFYTGFPTYRKSQGSYYDKHHGEELVFFADPEGTKCIKTFNLKGELKDSVSLAEVLKGRFLEDGINILSRDTILVNSYYPNSIFMLDHSGHVWKTIYLDEIVQWQDTTVEQLEHWSSTQPNSLFGQNGSLYFANSYHINLQLERFDKVTAYQRYFNLEHRQPYFLKVDNIFSASPKADVLLKDYYPMFSDNYESYSFVIPFYYTTDSLVFLFTPFSDKILYFPHGKPEQMTTFKITSEHSDIGFPPIEISEATIDIWSDEMNRTTQSNGGIICFYYHSQPQVYCTMTTLDKPDHKTMEENYYDRRFSLHILDKQLKKIAEYDYSYQGYDFGSSIPTKDGILIKKLNNSNNPKRHAKIEYTHLRFTR